MPTCRNCEAYFPNRVRIEGRLRNLHSRKFCLTCSPFGKHNTSQILVADPGLRRCPRCEKMLELKHFYLRRNGISSSFYCKDCTNQLVVDRQQRLKRMAVEYKGGRCAHCGYDRYIGSLEFHHIDPEIKEFNLAHFRSTSFEKVKDELDKCLLLCSNCHREEHARLKGLL